jgi:hypothetical protein
MGLTTQSACDMLDGMMEGIAMARYAVAHANLFDHDNTVEIVEARNARHAITLHSAIGEFDLSDMPIAIEEIKQYFFDMDTLVGVIEIPSQS